MHIKWFFAHRRKHKRRRRSAESVVQSREQLVSLLLLLSFPYLLASLCRGVSSCSKLFVKMSVGPTLRALVTARLTAAAEDIFALFERTIAEYEEELRLCKEKQRRQEQLETLRPRVMLLRAEDQLHPPSPVLCLDKEIQETPQIKEEPEERSISRNKQEEKQLPEPVPESSAASMKAEESSLLQQTELREETQGEDFSTDTFFLPQEEESFSDFNQVENHMDSFSCSAAQIKSEDDEDHYHQVQLRARETTAQNYSSNLYLDNGPETSASVNTGYFRGTGPGSRGRGFQCPYCEKVMKNRYKLNRHIVVHTGERPFSCSTCGKRFSQKSNRDVHVRLSKCSYNNDNVSVLLATSTFLDTQRRFT